GLGSVQKRQCLGVRHTSMLTHVELDQPESAGVEMGDKAPYDAGGVPADPAQGVRGEAALPFQADVRQSGMGGRQALPVARVAVAVEGAERAQIAEVGSVAGGQDDRVDLLGGAVGPCRL